MRARSREVNIFNMSLLDILTGMLGAFLFLMLGLVPYYTKAKHQNNNNNNPNATPPVDMTLNVISRWDNLAKVDFFLHASDGWHGSDKKSQPLSSRFKVQSGACPGADTWQMSSAYATAGNRYLMCVSPQGQYDPESLRTIRFSIEMLEAQSATDGSGVKSYYPDTMTGSYDASGAKPGSVYGVGWIDVTKDTTKGSTADDYNLQYDYTYTPVKADESLPDGAVPLPPAAPVSAIPMPVPEPGPAPTPVTNAAPTPATNAVSPPKSSGWSLFNFFHHDTPPPPEQNPH